MLSKKQPFLILVLCIMLFAAKTNFAQEGYSSHDTYIVFRMDDYGVDDFSIYTPIFQIFKKYGYCLTLGIVPFNSSNGSLATNLSREKIDLVKMNQSFLELALHGFTHEDRNPSSITSEFAGVDKNVQFKMILEGKSALDSIFNYNTQVFIPPWNSYDKNTVLALEKIGFSVISAAPYGVVSSPESRSISYIPHTVELDRFLLKFNNTFPPPGVYIVMMHDYIFEEAISSAEYKQKSHSKMSLNQLDNLLEKLSKSNSIKIVSFRKLDRMSLQLDSSRFANNIYFDEILQTFDFIKLSNYNYLESNEFNVVRRYNQLVGIVFYSTVLYFGFAIWRWCSKMDGLHAWYNTKKNVIQIFCLSSNLVFLLLLLRTFAPKYLLLFSFFSGITFAIAREYFPLKFGRSYMHQGKNDD